MVMPLIPMSEDKIYDFRANQLHEAFDRLVPFLKQEYTNAIYFDENGSIREMFRRDLLHNFIDAFNAPPYAMNDESWKFYRAQHFYQIILLAFLFWQQMDDKKNPSENIEMKEAKMLEKIYHYNYTVEPPKNAEQKILKSSIDTEIWNLHNHLKKMKLLYRGKRKKMPPEDLELLKILEMNPVNKKKLEKK